MGNKVKAEKAPKVRDPNKVGAGPMLAWTSRAVSVNIQVMLVGFLQIYCTSALGVKAVLVGTLLMACKIVDAVTDLVAGIVVDSTHTKWGKGRPYELCVIGLWLATWLLFTIPEEFSLVAKCVWIVICYTAAQSIFYTFLNANQTPYMIRAFNNEKKYVSLSSFGGLIAVVGVVIFNVVFPMFEAKIIYDAAGWSRLVAFIAVPMTILGLMRFVFVKEVYNVDTSADDRIHMKDVATLLKNCKSVYIIAIMTFVTSLIGNIGISQYYCLYIVENLEVSGILSVFTMICLPIMALFPRLMKKHSIAEIIMRFTFCSIASGIVAWFAGANLPLLAISMILSGLATLPQTYLGGLLLVDCGNYNEWQGRPRMDGTIGSINGFFNKLGSAFGSFVLGILLTVSGFVEQSTTQPASALFMIRFVFAGVPVIGAVIVIVLMNLWHKKMDSQKDQMMADLETRRGTTHTEQ